MVHFDRKMVTVVPHGKVREVAAMLKAIHAREKATAVEAKLREDREAAGTALRSQHAKYCFGEGLKKRPEKCAKEY